MEVMWDEPVTVTANGSLSASAHLFKVCQVFSALIPGPEWSQWADDIWI